MSVLLLEATRIHPARHDGAMGTFGAAGAVSGYTALFPTVASSLAHLQRHLCNRKRTIGQMHTRLNLDP